MTLKFISVNQYRSNRNKSLIKYNYTNKAVNSRYGPADEAKYKSNDVKIHGWPWASIWFKYSK